MNLALRRTIAITSLGFVMVQLDVTIVNVALAKIGIALNTSISGLQWMVDAYTIAIASTMMSAGAVGDRFGARKTFVLGMIVFSLSSLACGLAQTGAALVAFRVTQGLGAAMILPCSVSLLNFACGNNLKDKSRALGWWNAAGGVAIIAGPILGGLFVETIGWRSIFLINIPIGAFVIYVTKIHLQETKLVSQSSFDFLGQILIILTLITLTGGVIEIGALGWNIYRAMALIVISLIMIGCFVLVESRKKSAMLPLHFFKNITFCTAAIAGFVNNSVYYGVIFAASIYFQRALMYSPLQAGLAFIPLTGTGVISNLIGSRIAAGRGPRLPMVVGFFLASIGCFMLVGVNETTPYTHLIGGLALIPLGLGLAIPPMIYALLSTVPKERAGIASGVFNTVRQVGGAIGVAIFGALVAGDTQQIVKGVHTIFFTCSILLVGAAVISFIGIQRHVAIGKVTQN
jgi:DHA2 family methylenomycin A resistance protein-like MFS transporter